MTQTMSLSEFTQLYPRPLLFVCDTHRFSCDKAHLRDIKPFEITFKCSIKSLFLLMSIKLLFSAVDGNYVQF